MASSKSTKKSSSNSKKGTTTHSSASKTKSSSVSKKSSSTSSNSTQKTSHSISEEIHQEPFDNLYVCMNNYPEKRKQILYSVKNSLIMQEEYDKIIQLRKGKRQVLDDIKKKMSELNQEYQNLQELLPNVKNTFSYVEKEINEIDKHVNTLRRDKKYEEEEIQLENNLKESLENGSDDGTLNDKGKPIETAQALGYVKSEDAEKVTKKESSKSEKGSSRKKGKTRIDRIQNNLKVVEEKLKDL